MHIKSRQCETWIDFEAEANRLREYARLYYCPLPDRHLDIRINAREAAGLIARADFAQATADRLRLEAM